MNLGTQYYRPPFPVRKHWAEDFRRIRDSGLNTVQLWVIWAWVEARPSVFVYDDYDELVGLAEKNGLGVVLSTIAEVQPYWIHREVPGSEMVTNMGTKVVSSNRCECHFGLTPGGCTDHPGVWQRMSTFLAKTVEHYRKEPHLVGWDAWNELRWNVQADGLVCYCPHTLKAYRDWLAEQYGGLDGLNRAWMRRYGSWDEVTPGKVPDRPYTELMAFSNFLIERANRHAKARYDVMKPLDPSRPVTVHAAEPSPGCAGGAANTPIDRGNDWAFADHLDGVGCSSFPVWSGMDDADFGMRVEYVKSAAQGKRVWLSEVQGGRSSLGFTVHKSVDAVSQQRWIWNGLACGAETILFWCWRDEVFGRESGGFGIVGRDGLADDRVAALQKTGALIRQHKELLAAYQPDKPAVGVLFSPRTYGLYWAAESNAQRVKGAMRGYIRALIRHSIPYLVVEEDHLEPLADLKILYLPRLGVMTLTLEDALERFVRNGGTIVCESECGAFSPEGIYREPDERFTARLTGVREIGRRELPGPFDVEMDGRRLSLESVQWATPMVGGGSVLASHSEGSLLTEVPVGKGRVLLAGGYLGSAYLNTESPDFEAFVGLTARRAGWRPDLEVVEPKPARRSFVYLKSGTSGNKRLVFVFFPADADAVRLRFRSGFLDGEFVEDIIADEWFALTAAGGGHEVILPVSDWRFRVLVAG